jgi:hypothetical protein
MSKSDGGPTDKATRVFKDSWDDTKRYKKINKRSRKRIRDELKELSKMNPEDIIKEEEE